MCDYQHQLVGHNMDNIILKNISAPLLHLTRNVKYTDVMHSKETVKYSMHLHILFQYAVKRGRNMYSKFHLFDSYKVTNNSTKNKESQEACKGRKYTRFP